MLLHSLELSKVHGKAILSSFPFGLCCAVVHGKRCDVIRCACVVWSCRLAGRLVVITGAASGICKVSAAEFVRNGVKVILNDIQDDLGRAVAAKLGPDASYARCDVTNEAQIMAAVDLAVARHGRLDVMYNHAGVAGPMAIDSITSLDLVDYDRTMAINTRSIVAGIKHAACIIVPRQSGCILCTTSTAGILGGVAPVYCISKATVIGAVRAVAGELGHQGRPACGHWQSCSRRRVRRS